MHAARAFWAMKIHFGFAYVAPDYLKQDAEEWATRYGATHVCQIGTISRCPNVVLVGEGKEIGDQHYEYLLRDQSRCEMHPNALKETIGASDFTSFILFPGGFPLAPVLGELGRTQADVFADINFVSSDVRELSSLGRKFSSLILSTSSDLFLDGLDADPTRLTESLGNYCETILLKENRGGSRLFRSDATSFVSTPSQIRPVLHSVGVGDFFDAVFVAQQPLHGTKAALAYASFAAAEYASQLDDAAIRESVEAVLSISAAEIQQFGGVSLAWELRRSINIYLAAPDFDDVDTRPLNTLANALTYHNFSPRRPVKEHGQARPDSSSAQRLRLAEADLDLLENCELMVAVLLYDDPGTLIEIGIALEKGIPVIVFDPFKKAENLMLTELPALVSSDLDEVLAGVFVQAGKVVNEKR
jgi:nucleoside 2-deoxyribosyltransferase